jgi:hypothetical protein
METLLTTQRCAELLGFHRVSIALAIRTGLLKARRYGRAYLVRPSDLLDYARNHSRPSRFAHADFEALEAMR